MNHFAVTAGPASSTGMHSLLALLAEVRQPFTIDDAAAIGVDRHAVARLAHAGELRRVDRSAYVPAAVWSDATPEQRHLLRGRAVLRRYRSVVLSHTSAIVAHGLPTHGVDLDLVHVTRTGSGRAGRAARQRAVQVHPALPAAALTTVGDLAVCTAPVAALQVADWHGLEAGLVAAEAGLHRGAFTDGALAQTLNVVRLGRGRPDAAAVVRLASADSESPGETLTGLLLRSLGLGAPQQQVHISLPDGTIARVDFLLPDLGVVVEFDGAVKYADAQGRAELVREKRREDGLRAAGYAVVRLTWADLRRPRYVLALVRAATARAAA